MSNTVKWTPAQNQAITTRGSNVYVAASAGTGKTAVLTERCVQLLSDPQQPLPVANLLVLTFTEAAAEEMQARIQAKLWELYRSQPSPALRTQLLHLDAAQISTIHAFCKRTLDHAFYEADLDPTYQLLDEDAQRLLKAEALQALIDQAWQDESLAGPLHELLLGRRLRAKGEDFLYQIIRIHQFLEGIVDPEAWLDRTEQVASAGIDHPEINDAVRQMLQDELSLCLAQCRLAQHLDREVTPGGHWSDHIQTTMIEVLETCLEQVSEGPLDQACDTLLNTSFGSFKGKPKLKTMETSEADRIKAPIKKASERFARLKMLSSVSPAYTSSLQPAAQQQIQTLISLVREFRIQYTRAKQERNGLDFSDLEHRMLKLLTNSPAIKASLQAQYQQVFVDEYQDINDVQQAILQSIAGGDNLFGVGDIKQSIYAFRQSRPEIFLGMLESADKDGGGQRIDLQHNFRSQPVILDFVNKVFARIMTRSMGGMDYDERAQLLSGLADNTNEGTQKQAIELAILDESGDVEEIPAESDESATDPITACQRQAAWIAQRIQTMVGAETDEAEFQVLDRHSGEMRDVTYGDIVILLRSLSGRASEYVEILRLAGVPVSSQAVAGYFQATEISDMMALLQILDNPQQDVPLAAILRSALGKFDDSALTAIRLHGDGIDRHLSYYACVQAYAESGSDTELQTRLRTFLDLLQTWTTQIRQQGIASLLWHVYRESGYLAYVGALPNGEQRRANLLKLHDRAIQFEQNTSQQDTRSLTRFLEFVERLMEEGGDWAPAEPETTGENSVRIMTVHHSKGLEYPVVFMAELNRAFNRADSFGPCLLDEQATLGLQIMKPTWGGLIDTPTYEIIRHRRHGAMLAEELRVLYVALTRPRDRLILTGSWSVERVRNLVQEASLASESSLPDWLLRQVRCLGEWMILALAGQDSLQAALDLPVHPSSIEIPVQPQIVGPEEILTLNTTINQQREGLRQGGGIPKSTPQTKTLGLAQCHALHWQYPYQDFTNEPAKQSVSRLTHQDDEFAQLDVSRALERIPGCVQTKPRSQKSSSIDARQRGTAFHLIMETLPLEHEPSQQDIQNHAQALVTQGELEETVAEALDLESIHAFYQSRIGQYCFAEGSYVLREWPFTTAIPLSSNNGGGMITSDQCDDFTVVQGIIDLLIQTPKGLWIVDYKTDSVTKRNLAERVESYRGQLDLYAQAASQILDIPVLGKVLYFTALNEEVWL